MSYFIVKIAALVKIITLYKNWQTIIFTRIPIVKKPKTLVYKLRNGLKIIVRPADIVEARVVDNTYLGEYSYSGFEIQPQDTVIDIGAHIGSFTLLAASKASNGKVLAFEPASYNFSKLEKNVRLNNFSNVEIFKMGVFKKNGFVNLDISQPSSAHFTIFNGGEEFERVKTITLAEIFTKFKIRHCNLLKIDAEGAEFEILTTASVSVLKLIDKIVFEFHPRPRLLKSKGYFL